MLTISRVKPLLSVSPPRYKRPAAAASHLPRFSRRKAESLQVLCFLPALYVITPLPIFFKPSNCSQSRGLCTKGGATGEIRVIVGPMFAGKTTTLLKRIKSESINGRFQAADTGNNYYHLDKTLKDLCFTGRIKETVRLLCCSGVKVHSATYRLLLQECIFRKEYRKGRRIHWQMVAVGICAEGTGRGGFGFLWQDETMWFGTGPVYICISL